MTSIYELPDWDGPINEPEQALIEHATSGELLDLGGGPVPTDDQPILELEEMQAWGADRTIRAEVLRHLLVVSEGPVQAKGVRLRGARVSGPLDLESATLCCPLVLEDCFLDSEQSVVFDYATVTLVRLVRCRLAGLAAGLLVVTKELDLTGSTFTGFVQLVGADISDQLTLRGATISGRDPDESALVADGVRVGGAVFLDDGFTADGAVRLHSADITGPLVCSGARITGTDTDHNALVADGVKVGGNMLLNCGFTSAGTVGLVGARIGGGLSLQDATLSDPVALDAQGARIGQQLLWAPARAVTGLVNLDRAQVKRLDDDWSKDGAYWPAAGKLRLAGFVYEGFGGKNLATCQQRLDWVQSQHRKPLQGQPARFGAQPYEQLARVYRLMGHEDDALRVAIAGRNDLSTYSDMGRLRRTGNRLLDVTIKHGDQPLRAVGALLAVFVVAFLLLY